MVKATIADVARRAGVTKSTVSHALSGKRPVSEETRRRIEEAIAALGYRPNPLAQRLAAGRSGAIGFLYPVSADRVTGGETEAISAASRVISAAGLGLVLFAQPDRNAAELRMFVESGLLDGLIVAGVQMRDERVRLLCEANAPFVMMGRTADNSGLNFVDVDVDAAIEAAAEHLVDRGHLRIAFLHEDTHANAAASRALQAYERTCARRRVRLVTPSCEPSAAAARVATRALLAHQPDITGLAVWGDAVAIGAYRAAIESERRVPEDLSLVCLGKSRLAELADLDLTCVDLHYGKQAELAAAMLLEILSGAAPGDQQVLLQPEWSDGETTATPR